MEKVKEPRLEGKHQGAKRRSLITKDNGRTSNKQDAQERNRQSTSPH